MTTIVSLDRLDRVQREEAALVLNLALAPTSVALPLSVVAAPSSPV